MSDWYNAKIMATYNPGHFVVELDSTDVVHMAMESKQAAPALGPQILYWDVMRAS